MLVIEKEWFHNERSYNAFIYAVDVTQKLEALRIKGAMIFDGEDLITGRWVVELDGVNSYTGYRHDSERSTTIQMYYGVCHDCESGKLWYTMKEIKASYADIKVVMPQHIITVGKL